MRVLLIGCKGNMGQRYASILKHLEVPFTGMDIEDRYFPSKYSHIIVATPTYTHLYFSKLFAADGRLTLIEKPLVTNKRDFNKLKKRLTDNIFMVNQYQYLTQEEDCGDTYWNYCKSGSDGLIWDAIQITHIAKGNCTIANESPVWTCELNGRQILLSQMDHAYIKMIKDFLGERKLCWGKDEIIKAHERVLGFKGK